MPNPDWSQCGCLRLGASESLTALVGLEVLFKALAALDGGHEALHAALGERLEDLDAVARCGVDPGPSRHTVLMLREMVERVAPSAAGLARAA